MYTVYEIDPRMAIAVLPSWRPLLFGRDFVFRANNIGGISVPSIAQPMREPGPV
jgi:hypothetical protein